MLSAAGKGRKSLVASIKKVAVPRQKKMPMRTIDEVDPIEEIISGGVGTKLSSTFAAYRAVNKALFAFLKVAYPEDISLKGLHVLPIEHVTDRNFAAFSAEYGSSSSYGESQCKKMNAVFTWTTKRHSMAFRKALHGYNKACFPLHHTSQRRSKGRIYEL
jgi:hypothetical protein